MGYITEISKKVEPVSFIEDNLVLCFKHQYGEHYRKFYAELRDNRKIFGMRCNKCSSVLLPPRPYCGFCHAPLKQWVELSDRGIVDTYSSVHKAFLNQIAELPRLYAMVKLDGCDVPIFHLLGETEYENAEIGMRVAAVWEESRKGTLRDIRYFKPEL